MSDTRYTPADFGLPTSFGDTESSHGNEDEALWKFVLWVAEHCPHQHTRRIATGFIDWDNEHKDRTRWYA